MIIYISGLGIITGFYSMGLSCNGTPTPSLLILIHTLFHIQGGDLIIAEKYAFTSPVS